MFNGGDDGVAVTDADMVSTAALLSNPQDTPLTILMDGGWNTPVYQQALDSICQARKDCVAVFGVPYAEEVMSGYLNAILMYQSTTLNLNSSYSALYTPHVKVFDKYNNRQIYVSPDGYAAAAISLSASNFEIWFPPAGFTRGSVTVLDLRRRYTVGEMDTLYDNNINPLRFVPGKGIFIWGQKTLSTRPSALDRLNVRLLLITIEPAINAALENFLFDLNDAATQALATALVTSYMDGIKASRGVTDFEVICNSTNNSADDVDNGIMNLWLFVKPTRSLETIPFSVIITSTGISFSLAAQLVP
jgi:phage tail sheath protein FI